jgi:hypothetical protein
MRRVLKNAAWISLAILLVIFVLFPLTFSRYQESSEQRNASAEPTQGEYNAMYLKVATDGYREAVEGIGDPAFTAYVFSVLDKRCSFYVPDGSRYRDFLWNVVSEKEAAYTKSSPTIREIDNSCQSIASNLGGLVAGEIVLSCRAFKLSLN